MRLKSRRPMFFGALAEVNPGQEPHQGDGFVIITAASDLGMVDIHDRRPLVLTPEHANEWLDPGITPSRAEEIARELCQPTEEFEWFPVSKAVGNVRNQGPALINPAIG
ncbi:SOS response-associated peptidase family protein [Pseudomonas fluorescens group sp.]|nr:SOS response-associated peptidase family protein [Pseudomonas fluorescens group sp.]MBZ6460355.1 SOS response-associated peptidase family protein [Pseudomonas fluorescens group sp.]MBZ6465997.1 SOS response-associated peptidase family protein [Pseudomonas fluorescens group sp.]